MSVFWGDSEVISKGLESSEIMTTFKSLAIIKLDQSSDETP